MKKVVLLNSFEDLDSKELCMDVAFNLNRGGRVVLDFKDIINIDFTVLESMLIKILNSVKYNEIKDRLSFKNAVPKIRNSICHIVGEYVKKWVS